MADSDLFGVGMAISDCIDRWRQTTPWLATLRSLCAVPSKFDAWMTSYALGLAAFDVTKTFSQHDAGVVLSVAATPYLTRHFQGEEAQKRAAAGIHNHVENMAVGVSSVVMLREYSSFVDSMIWSLLSDDDERFKAHSAQNMEFAFVLLETAFQKILKSHGGS